jgi:excisionase family DNA binding protein
MSNQTFLDADEVCELLKMKKSWLYQNHENSGMPVHRVGRKLLFNKDEIVNWALAQ